MNGYLTDKQFEDNIDLPISLSLTELRVTDWLVVSSVNLPIYNPLNLPENPALTVRWLQLRLTKGVGVVKLGLFKNFNIGASPTTQLASLVGSELLTANTATPLVSRDPFSPVTIAPTPGGGIYSWVAWCESGSVLSTDLINGGNAYTSTPLVVFSGGGGGGAAANATVFNPGPNGIVSSMALTLIGGNYASVPSVLFSGGGGTGAIAKANVGCIFTVNGGCRVDLNPI